LKAAFGGCFKEDYADVAYKTLKSAVLTRINTGEAVVFEGYVQVSFFIERRD
jgi:hypothetical protein